jgi:hypothetical protein
VNVPIPVPSEDLLLAIVGPVAVPQQTPLAVTGDPPSAVILPPHQKVLVEDPMVRLVVVTMGAEASVLNVETGL